MSEQLSSNHEQSTSSSATAGNRRRAERRPYEASVALSILQKDNEIAGPILVQAMDISVGGIAILSRNMMHPGTIGALHLLMPGGATTVVGVKVANCHYLGEMKHRVGLQFTELHEKLANSPHVPAHCRVLESAIAHRTFLHSLRGDGDKE